MPLDCEFVGSVVITSKKSEKQKDGAGIHAEVLKMHGFIEEAALAKLLNVSTTEIKSWWFHDDGGLPRFQLVKCIKLDNVYIDHTLKIDDMDFDNVDLDQFEVVLKKNRRAGVTFQAKFRSPTALQIEQLSHYFAEQINDLEVCSGPQTDIED